MTSEHVKFFGLSEDKMYYDERKKRFVNTNDVPMYIERAYKNSHFKDVSTPFRFRTNTNDFSNDLISMDKRRGSSRLS